VVIPRKQRSTQEDWTATLEDAYARPDRARADDLVGRAAEALRARLSDAARPAYGWSGGKDSQGLRIVADAAGLTTAVSVISELEYPAFLEWLTDNMPHDCWVEDVGLDLDWLRLHPEMLFPDGPHAAKWFSLLQHSGQRAYCRSEGCDLLVLGRRTADGNFIGRGENEYVDRGGFIRYSPIADWTHEDLLCVLGAHASPLPPCYWWPRGFRVGTGPWPARQWCPDRAAGWAEVTEIDPRVTELAAEANIPGAEEALCAASS